MKTAEKKKIKQRLEYLRGELRGERISYDELHELQSLADHIDPDDVELLEPAGVPERLPMVPLEEALMDYEVVKAPNAAKKIVASVLTKRAFFFRTLKLSKPRVAFIKAENNMVAVYIAGTTNNPVIGLVAAPHMEMEDPEKAIDSSIVHEAIHAYLESCGMDTADHDETMVESATRNYCDGVLGAESTKSYLDDCVIDHEIASH